MSALEVRHFHLFCGLGGGAAGFNRGEARVGSMHARFRCLGGVDVSPAALADFGRLAGVAGTQLDLFDRQQYRAWHGCEPPAGWCEATPADIRRAAGGERPHVVFTSAPCKGFSGLLNERASRSARYQALNALTVRGIWLTLEAWRDDPPEFVLFENVPRIASRGRALLDRITALLRHYGYAVAETVHDCGVLGGLAQSRKRFLLVARHMERVPPFLYEPLARPLRSVGDVLGRMPLPGDPAGGSMHRVPELQWRTWVRLALIEAGGDWRSLQSLRVVDGVLAEFGIVPDRGWHAGVAGVRRWEQHAYTVTGNARPMTGAFSVADPRFAGSGEYGQFGVRCWEEPTGTVTGQRSPGQGAFSVADPRHHGPVKHSNEFRVVPYDRSAMAITSAHGSGQCVADPRHRHGEVISGGLEHIGQSAAAAPLPAADERLVAVIQAIDGTWHRPFTTLELAALQGLYDPDADAGLVLEGASDSAHRERIGNAVPPPAAQAIASVIGRTLLLAWAGETFLLSADPIWVRPIASAVAMTGLTGGAPSC